MKAPTVEDVAKGDSRALSSLSEYLKLHSLSLDPAGKSSDLSTALTKLQQSARLPETGIYDRATADLINQPRCSVTNFYTHGSLDTFTDHTWTRRTLTYCFDRYSDHLPVFRTREIIADAFEQWATFSPLTFTEVAPHLEAVDIRILWARGDHGDGVPFDGSKSADENQHSHSFYPPPLLSPHQLVGDIHFDEDENWTSHRLSQVAVHQIGHSLGLVHSSVPEAIMWPHWTERDRLHADDIEAIQAKYGVREGSWRQICGPSNAAQIVATSGGDLYRRDSNGHIWQHRSPLNWYELDDNKDTAQIDASSHFLDQRHHDGQVYRWLKGVWKWIDSGKSNVQIASARNGRDLYQRHESGQVWKYNGSPSWEWLDHNRATVQIAANASQVFLLHSNGQVFLYTGKPGDWNNICSNSDTVQIVAEGHTLYRLCSSGKVFQMTAHYKWKLLDHNGNNAEIVADRGNLYSRHSNGDVFWYTGTPMKWLNLSSGREVVQLAAGGEALYCRCANGTIWQILEGCRFP